MTTIDMLGYSAAFLTSASFVPQAVLVIRTRRTGGISLLMYSMFVLGVAMWFLYGFKTGAIPIMASNAVTLTLAGSILLIAARERWDRRGTLKARKPGVPLTPEQNPDIDVGSVGED